MVTFSEVRKTSEASKYVCYWREVGGVKAASGVLGGSVKSLTELCLTVFYLCIL